MRSTVGIFLIWLGLCVIAYSLLYPLIRMSSRESRAEEDRDRNAHEPL